VPAALVRRVRQGQRAGRQHALQVSAQGAGPAVGPAASWRPGPAALPTEGKGPQAAARPAPDELARAKGRDSRETAVWRLSSSCPAAVRRLGARGRCALPPPPPPPTATSHRPQVRDVRARLLRGPPPARPRDHGRVRAVPDHGPAPPQQRLLHPLQVRARGGSGARRSGCCR
jgi:hypothetical protein